MRSRRIALFVLLAAIALPLTVESAPVPKTPVQAFIHFEKPPKGITLEAYLDQQILHLRQKSVRDVVDCARSDAVLDETPNGGDALHYSKLLGLPIVKERKETEALLTRKHVEPGTGRNVFTRLPAEKERKALETWLNENLLIEPAGTRTIRIRFTAGSKSEQAFIINALVATYDFWGPRGEQGRLLGNIKGAHEIISNRREKYLLPLEATLAQLKKELPKDKAAAATLARKRTGTEWKIGEVKSRIKEYEELIRKWQAELDDLPPEPSIRWAKE